MFQKMKIRNFQKHQSLVIEFDDRVTTIVGKTNAGKSAIIRALGLLCLSRWKDCYVRHGKKHVTVELTVDDKIILREKGKGKNVYAIDGKRFAAFAQSVPPEIEQCLNVTPDNFQRQLDSHFWFSDTSGQVSKKLNQIVNLEVIDRTLANVASEVKRTRAELSVCESRHSDAKKQVQELGWVPEFVRDFQAVETVEKRLEKTRSKIASVERTLAPARLLVASVERAQNAILDAKNVTRARAEYDTARQKRKNVERLLKELKQAKQDKQLPELDFSEIEALRIKGDKIAEDARNVEVFLEELLEARERTWQVEAKIEAVQKELDKLPKQKRCSKCGSFVGRSAPSHPTCTSATKPPSPGPRKKIGSTSSSSLSARSKLTAMQKTFRL